MEASADEFGRMLPFFRRKRLKKYALKIYALLNFHGWLHFGSTYVTSVDVSS